jgi:hypothetical protein
MTVPKRVEIARFPGNKRIALTMSWDDGVVEDKPLIKLFNELGLKGTFNLNSATFFTEGRPRPLEGGGRLDLSEVRDLYEGHEVAIHTASHPFLERLDPSQVAYEILDDRRALEDIVGYPVRGMAYPFGTYNKNVKEILRSLGIVYARAVKNAENDWLPADPMEWSPMMHMFGKDPAGMVERFQTWVGNPRKTGLFYIWGHSYEFARPTDRWKEMDGLFRPLAGHPEVWYCTNIQLWDYEAARQRMCIAANRKTAYNPSARPVTLVCDGKVIDVPGGQTVSLVAG